MANCGSAVSRVFYVVPVLAVVVRRHRLGQKLRKLREREELRCS